VQDNQCYMGVHPGNLSPSTWKASSRFNWTTQ